MKATVKPPVRSGFCNPSNPPDSHGRCRKADCPCEHHTTETEPLLWEGDQG